VAENADQTVVQEAIYYKIYVDIDPRDLDLKSGMTANLTILTGERKDVLVVPSRSLRLTDSQVSVRVLEGREAHVRDIQIGLRGDEGRVEVVSGLTEGESVVTGEIVSGP
jgi:HlyD family secretion protein